METSEVNSHTYGQSSTKEAGIIQGRKDIYSASGTGEAGQLSINQ